MAIIAAATHYNWSLSGLYASPAALASWSAAAALGVVALTALAHKASHVGWFHPLSLPLAVITIMALGAMLWVHFTRQPAGLLFEPGYQPPGPQALTVAVSATACEALTLVVVGYMAGAVAALILMRQAKPTATGQRWPMFRYRDMRHAGFLLMAAGAALQLAAAVLERGTAYGVNQLQYGLASALSSGAARLLPIGLILVALTASHEARPRLLRDVLQGREWTVLVLYMAAVAATGQRGILINPLFYLAWAYSTQVRAIPFKWIVTAVLLALTGGAVIAAYRADAGLSPGSPSTIVHGAVGAVSSTPWLTQETVTRVPLPVPYTNGSTYLAAVEAQLPGPLSRAAGITSRTASAVFRNLIGFYDPNQGFAESYPSEAYLNFGLPGCFGAGLFLGALMGWAWRKHRKTVARSRDLLYVVLIAGLIGGFRSDALADVKNVLYPMLGVWVLMEWYRLRAPAAQTDVPSTAAAIRGVSWDNPD